MMSYHAAHAICCTCVRALACDDVMPYSGCYRACPRVDAVTCRITPCFTIQAVAVTVLSVSMLSMQLLMHVMSVVMSVCLLLMIHDWCDERHDVRGWHAPEHATCSCAMHYATTSMTRHDVTSHPASLAICACTCSLPYLSFQLVQRMLM